MCDVADALGMGLAEVGEFEVEELCIRAVRQTQRRREEELREEMRLGRVCSAIALFAMGSNEDWPPERFFPALAAAQDDQMTKRLFAAFTAAAAIQK